MKKMKPFVKYMLIAGLIFGLFFGAGAGLSSMLFDSPSIAETDEEEPDKEAANDGKRTSILVLGVDARDGEKNSRSDTMILVTIDPEIDKAAFISIPRDTKVELRGGTVEKICTANYYGGPQYAVETVEKLMGNNIDYYVEMDFKGFKEIVDTLGGVTINVPERMYKPTEDIDLYPGKQKLSGRQALAFVRYRDYTMGDIQRTAAQQDFLKALAVEVLKPKTLTKLPALAKQLNKYMDTDLKTSDMIKMASWAPGFNTESIAAQTMPGYFYDEFDENGNLTASFWIADKKQLSSLVDKMLTGETVAVIQSSPIPQKRPTPKTQVTGDQENIIDRDKERASLPSPGHGSTPTNAVQVNNNNTVTNKTGPEGYI